MLLLWVILISMVHEAMLMSVIIVALGNHVDVHDAIT